MGDISLRRTDQVSGENCSAHSSSCDSPTAAAYLQQHGGYPSASPSSRVCCPVERSSCMALRAIAPRRLTVTNPSISAQQARPRLRIQRLHFCTSRGATFTRIAGRSPAIKCVRSVLTEGLKKNGSTQLLRIQTMINWVTPGGVTSMNPAASAALQDAKFDLRM